MRKSELMNNIAKFLINGTLDLHTFHPSDVKALVPDYLIECKKIGIYDYFMKLYDYHFNDKNLNIREKIEKQS